MIDPFEMKDESKKAVLPELDDEELLFGKTVSNNELTCPRREVHKPSTKLSNKASSPPKKQPSPKKVNQKEKVVIKIEDDPKDAHLIDLTTEFRRDKLVNFANRQKFDMIRKDLTDLFEIDRKLNPKLKHKFNITKSQGHLLKYQSTRKIRQL